MSKVSIDYKELKNASNKILKSYEKLDSCISKYNINMTQIHVLKIDDQVRAAYNDLTKCISQEKKLLQNNNEELLDIISKIKSWDTKRTKKSLVKYIKSNDSTKVTTKYKKLVSLLGAKKAQKYLKNQASKLGYNVKISESVVSLTKKKITSASTLAKSTGAVVTNTKTIVSTIQSTSTTSTDKTKTTSTKKEKIQRLKQKLRKYLKNENLTAAATTYSSLVALMGEDKAKAYLKKLGYKATKKNGKVTISKISKETTKKTETADKDKNTIKDEKDTTSDGNSDNDKPTEDNKAENDKQTTDDSSTTNNEQNTQDNNNEAVATETVTKEEQSTIVEQTPNKEKNYNTTTQEVSTSANGDVVTESTTDNSTDANNTNSVDTNTEVNDTNTNSAVTEGKGNNNVISITEDDDSFSSSSKTSSGLGAAVPIGLGAIATGAAAVAGVRYVKSRHENQEDYDENYDDENNNLTSENQYVDSAQYDTDSSYMDDNYLGPAGSSYTDVDLDLEEDAILNNSEESYIDPEELEESLDADFEDDSVLKELSNY